MAAPKAKICESVSLKEHKDIGLTNITGFIKKLLSAWLRNLQKLYSKI